MSGAAKSWWAAGQQVVRVATALAIVAAVAAQLQNLHDREILKVGNFFSFFTINSNLLAVVLLIGLETSATSVLGRFARWARGGITLYMAMTGIIYAALLAPVAADVSTQLAWVNAVLHIVAPIVVVADWLLDPPDPAPTVRATVGWLAFPMAWLAYTFVRGAVTGFYPYPFLNPNDDVAHASGSWPAVVATTAVLAVAVAGLALVLRRLATRRQPTPAP